ncbi:MAG: hypothetical protein OSB19_00790 [Opitutaceae bacterium]|nr:hypothetical protein [Opitutaceae bacterium]
MQAFIRRFSDASAARPRRAGKPPVGGPVGERGVEIDGFSRGCAKLLAESDGANDWALSVESRRVQYIPDFKNGLHPMHMPDSHAMISFDMGFIR